MPPDLDLDLVEEEARAEERRREEEERRQQKEEEGWRRKEEEEEQRRRRSQTVRQKKRDDQREEGRRSRSLPRNGARSWDTIQPEEQMEVEESGGRKRERRSETKSRRREREASREEEERDISGARHAKHSGSSSAGQRAAFSFLMPMDDDKHLSDSESAASFSEVSLSAASIATVEWREDSHWRRVESPWRQGNAPGPWLKPSPKRLTQVLIGSRLSGQELAGGLSL